MTAVSVGVGIGSGGDSEVVMGAKVRMPLWEAYFNVPVMAPPLALATVFLPLQIWFALRKASSVSNYELAQLLLGTLRFFFFFC